jgi:hypothetical protein
MGPHYDHEGLTPRVDSWDTAQAVHRGLFPNGFLKTLRALHCGSQ